MSLKMESFSAWPKANVEGEEKKKAINQSFKATKPMNKLWLSYTDSFAIVSKKKEILTSGAKFAWNRLVCYR